MARSGPQVRPHPAASNRNGHQEGAPVSEPDELLGFALEALDEIDALVGYGHDEFAASRPALIPIITIGPH